MQTFDRKDWIMGAESFNFAFALKYFLYGNLLTLDSVSLFLHKNCPTKNFYRQFSDSPKFSREQRPRLPTATTPLVRTANEFTNSLSPYYHE